MSVISLLVEVAAQKSCDSSVGWVSDTHWEPRRGDSVIGCRALLEDLGDRQ